MAYKKITLDEKLDMGMKSFEEEGRLEEADSVRKLIPLALPLAKFSKEKFGADFLMQEGYLSEAEAEYGEDWLTEQYRSECI
jgi:hypothetical protein